MLHGWEVRALCVVQAAECSSSGAGASGAHGAIVGSAEKLLRVLRAPRHFEVAVHGVSAASSGREGEEET